MSIPANSRRLMILSCSMTKRDGSKWMSAIDRYDGPLWQSWRTADRSEKLARLGFVSARYGFREARTTIELYDARMTAEIAATMKAGGLGMRWPQHKTQRRVMPEGEHPGMHIAWMTDYGRRPFVEVCLVGGRLYLDVMRHFVDLFRENGFVTGSAHQTEICGPTGFMRRDMTAWLKQADGPQRERHVEAM